MRASRGRDDPASTIPAIATSLGRREEVVRLIRHSPAIKSDLKIVVARSAGKRAAGAAKARSFASAIGLVLLAAACSKGPESARTDADGGRPPLARTRRRASRLTTWRSARAVRRETARRSSGSASTASTGSLLDRLSREGTHAALEAADVGGLHGALRSYLPVLSPIIWTTLATGVGPDVHRVLDFQEVDPATGQKVPISGRSRAVPAIWNVASASGVSVGVVGWWGSHPAEEVHGFFVSDHASPILFEGLPRQGLAYPASLSAGVEQIVAREGEVSDAELARYVDASAEDIARARASGEGLKNPIIALARTIAATRVQSRIARELYDRNLPDLMMLYLEGTDVVGHVFASYVPPKLSCVSDADFARYRNAVDEYYALVDRILGQWMRRAEEDGATLIVNSDHGFKWGEDRSCVRDSLNPSTAGFWHRLDGVFAAWGARVERSSTRGDASVFDVAPTVSALLSPAARAARVGRHREGRVPRPVRPRPARPVVDPGPAPVGRAAVGERSQRVHEEAPGARLPVGRRAGQARSVGRRPSRPDRGRLEQPRALPFGQPRPQRLPGGRSGVQEGAGAAARLPLAAVQPGRCSYRRQGKDGQAIEWLFRSLQAGHADPTGTVLEWSGHYGSEGKKAAPSGRSSSGRSASTRRSEALARPLAILRFQGKDCAGAEAAVAPFAAATRDPDTLNVLGLLNTCLGRPDEAIAFFQRSLAVKPDQPGAIRSLDLLQKGLPSGQKQP